MEDTIIKGTGNSRTLISVPNFLTLFPSWEDFGREIATNGIPIDLSGPNPAGCEAIGTPLDKANLLSDETAEKIKSAFGEKPETVDEALDKISGGNSTCLTFSSDAGFSLGMYDNSPHWNGIVEYSYDKISWYVWDGKTIQSRNGKLYMRGIQNTIIVGSNASNGFFAISGSNVSCSGNIETLLDYKTVTNGEHPKMDSYCFNRLFSSCTALIKAPDLPATELSAYCYHNMFEGCRNLLECPELPAKEMEVECYYHMFYGCVSLKKAPALPAKTLKNACYEGMFMDCVLLSRLPKLPASDLASRCYDSMFVNCSALKLSQQKTDEYRYEYRIPYNSDGTLGSSSLNNMFLRTGGTFTGTPSINTTYYTTEEPV